MIFFTDELKPLEIRLRQLSTNILLSEKQLNIWADKIIDFRALQMDGIIVGACIVLNCCAIAYKYTLFIGLR
jgi:hypothetical protein